MEKKEKVIFTNMCMIYDDNGNVLVQERVSSNWPGIAFPGGHVEKGEPFADSVIREVYEETGLTISNVQLCGIKEWFKSNGTRYVVLLYKTNEFKGTLSSSDEGNVWWENLKNLKNKKLAESMEVTLKVYLENKFSEHFCCQENGEWIQILK